MAALLLKLFSPKSQTFYVGRKLKPGIFNNEYLNCKFSSQSAKVSEASAEYDGIPTYPPVKPRYPPGVWANISEHSAWLIHERSHEQLRIPRVKERLESMAGDKGRILWVPKKVDPRPNNLDFKQSITKTHVVNGLPLGVYDKIDVDTAYSRIKSLVPELILQEYEFLHKHRLEKDMNWRECDDVKRYVMHQLLGSITRTFMASLLPSHGHLRRCQLDEDVRVESFWHFGGFSGKEKKARGKCLGFTSKEEVDLGMLIFQYKDMVDWQIRGEMPLPKFISQDDPICREGFVPTIDYTPSATGMVQNHDRPISVSGHWIGDPCEFGLVQVHTWPTEDYERFKELGEKYLRTAEISFGLVAGFGSCLSQAYNQGFSDWLELTYPLTSQCIVASNNEFRFFSYQLNTVQMWNDAKTIRNILWASEPMKMFDVIEDGQVKGLNDDAFKTFLKFFMVKPVEEGHDLRPYLPEEEAPFRKSIYINFKGQEPLPVKKIGRYEFPKNAVYF